MVSFKSHNFFILFFNRYNLKLSVLSRNHALIWYENGKFFLQDTKSSNGTFVNNQRLSKGSEESMPREVCSGDILQVHKSVITLNLSRSIVKKKNRKRADSNDYVNL
jgi:pSer/pThr/pTyr-binding forkhead associated (FHA) protein